jgi:cytochrome c553
MPVAVQAAAGRCGKGQGTARQCACAGQWFKASSAASTRLAGLPEYYLLTMIGSTGGTLNWQPRPSSGPVHPAEEDIASLAAYIADIDLAATLHLNIHRPRRRRGGDTYSSDCKTCHGRKGAGKTSRTHRPARVITQYQRQNDLFRKQSASTRRWRYGRLF